MNVFKKVPIPICAVILGMFGLGNLLQSYSEGVRLLCGAVGAVLMVMFLIRVLLDWKKFCNEMENPILASVFCAFPMAVMMLATYVKPYIGSPAKVIWFVGVAIHVVMILYFTVKFLLHFSLEKVFASWFIVYVGIAMAGITAPAFGTESIGSACVWFGIVSLVVLLLLCIAGYIQSVTPKSLSLLTVLWAVATVLFVLACIKFVQYWKLPFFPSYSAYTFPFVISAIASKQLMACAANLGNPMGFLSTVVLVETIIATCTTLYALIRYLIFLFQEPKQAAK